MDENFLLGSKNAQKLYHNCAAALPVIDYHCHIDAADILADKRFSDLTDAWLAHDHYKWRLMRACGVSEEYITGDAPGYEKFLAFAGILPRCAGNPVYHWAHMELQRFFSITRPLDGASARDIWEETGEKLRNDATLSARGIPGRMNVKAIITTDDPADNLDKHAELAGESDLQFRVLPCFRPDAVLNIESDTYLEYITKLDRSISNFEDLKRALSRKLEYFDTFGCRAADHGLRGITYSPGNDKAVTAIIKKALHGNNISPYEADKYKSTLLTFLAGEYTRLGWVMELHLGVLRDVNAAAALHCGANAGFDSIGAPADIMQLGRMLSALDEEKILPKTIIFSINPNDNAAINTLAGCFTAGGVTGKVQQGSAWWFNDSSGGIKQQLECFARYGALGGFIGMLTDSRSLLSFPRHEYFRRILCGFIGEMVDSGEYPDDNDLLEKLVSDICYYNAKRYFGL